jgi:chromosome segregation ATPase
VDIMSRLNDSDALSDEFDNMNINKSYASAASSLQNGSSSSKAVLAALRALQDKIRRLEAERTQALDETSQLKHQLKTQEIESEHAKQKELLTVQKNLQEAKSSYDRLFHEKTELELRLSRLEEKNKLLQGNTEDLQAKIHHLESEKHQSALRVKDLEYQYKQIEQQIKDTQGKEKGIFSSILTMKIMKINLFITLFLL